MTKNKKPLSEKDLLKMKKRLDANLSEKQLKEREEYTRNMSKCYFDLARELEEEIKIAMIKIEGFIPGPKMMAKYAQRVVSQDFKGYMDFHWRDKPVLRISQPQVERKENGDGTMSFKISQKIEKLY